MRHQPSTVGLLSSRAMVWSGLGIAVAVMVVTLVVAPLIDAATQAHPPLVVAKAPLGQTVQRLLDGKFVERVSCRRACTMTTSAVIRARTGATSRFQGRRGRAVGRDRYREGGPQSKDAHQDQDSPQCAGEAEASTGQDRSSGPRKSQSYVNSEPARERLGRLVRHVLPPLARVSLCFNPTG